MLNKNIILGFALVFCLVSLIRANISSECDEYLNDIVQGPSKRSHDIDASASSQSTANNNEMARRKEHFLSCLPYLMNELNKLEAFQVDEETNDENGMPFAREARRVKTFWKRRVGGGKVKNFW